MDIHFAVDLGLILRCLGALLWGIGWALVLQFNRFGKFLAQERTWIAVVVGVGVDLLIGLGDVSRALGIVHKTQRTLEVARYGQPEKKK